jgi:hypothetical protein
VTFVTWALQYGEAGDVLETEQEPVFRFPGPGDSVIVEEIRERKYKDEDGNDVTLDAYVPVEKPKYPESVLGVARFDKDYAAVEKNHDRYQSSKRELMSKMLFAS